VRTGRIPIKKSPQIGQALSFLSLRTRWAFRLLPTENRQIDQMSNSFTLLTKNAKSRKSKVFKILHTFRKWSIDFSLCKK
jgi:hypothetical protein